MSECLTVENYEKIELQGATKVVSATTTQAVVETSTKTIIVTGANLEITKLDLDNHLVCMSGSISNLKFSLSSGQKPGLLKRIFK